MTKDKTTPGWAVRAETLKGKWKKIAWYSDRDAAIDAAQTLNAVSGFPINEGDGNVYVFDVVNHRIGRTS